MNVCKDSLSEKQPTNLTEILYKLGFDCTKPKIQRLLSECHALLVRTIPPLREDPLQNFYLSLHTFLESKLLNPKMTRRALALHIQHGIRKAIRAVIQRLRSQPSNEQPEICWGTLDLESWYREFLQKHTIESEVLPPIPSELRTEGAMVMVKNEESIVGAKHREQTFRIISPIQYGEIVRLSSMEPQSPHFRHQGTVTRCEEYADRIFEVSLENPDKTEVRIIIGVLQTPEDRQKAYEQLQVILSNLRSNGLQVLSYSFGDFENACFTEETVSLVLSPNGLNGIHASLEGGRWALYFTNGYAESENNMRILLTDKLEEAGILVAKDAYMGHV